MSIDHSDSVGWPAEPTRVYRTRDMPFRCSTCRSECHDKTEGCWTCRWLPHVVRKIGRG